MLPATGSTMMPAMRAPSALNADSTASRSLYGSTRVSPASAGGTPADDGCPNVGGPWKPRCAVSRPPAPQKPAGEPQPRHRRLGARRHEPHELDRRQKAAEL